jgi:DeoR family transcriptional regulator, suf operon transcriptional repressor
MSLPKPSGPPPSGLKLTALQPSGSGSPIQAETGACQMQSAAGHGHPPTREAVLSQLLRQGEATAADLANRLGVSVQVMRRHLRSLEEEGLVEALTPHEGPGRPSNHWHLTSHGHDHFPDGSESFALGLLQSIATSLPPDALRTLLDQQAREKALQYRRSIGEGPLQERLERLLQLRREEGYLAELRTEAAGQADIPSEGWILSEFHCSVMRIAEEFPAVCDQELQLLRHTFPDCQVERVHWRLDEGHSCGFRLSPLPDPA